MLTIAKSWSGLIVFAAGVLVGGGMLSALPRVVEAGTTTTQPAHLIDRCSGGTDVSAFVCATPG